MRDPSEAVRSRVKELLRQRADVNQVQFGKAVSRGPAWVSAFLSGRRGANDLALVVRIARFFGVTVGYLLNETDRNRDAGAMTLLAIYDELLTEDRDLVLQWALGLRRARAATRGGEPNDERAHGPTREERRSISGAKKVRETSSR